MFESDIKHETFVSCLNQQIIVKKLSINMKLMHSRTIYSSRDIPVLKTQFLTREQIEGYLVVQK